MNQKKDCRIEQCLNDMKKYEEWGRALTGLCWFNVFNYNVPISETVIHYGMEYIKAKMKLNVLQDEIHSEHTEKEKEERLNQIDIDIHQTEEIMKHDLEFRGLLMHP